MALAVVLLHHQPILVLEDGREHEPIVLDVLAYTILLKKAVVTGWSDLHKRRWTYHAVKNVTIPTDPTTRPVFDDCTGAVPIGGESSPQLRSIQGRVHALAHARHNYAAVTYRSGVVEYFVHLIFHGVLRSTHKTSSRLSRPAA